MLLIGGLSSAAVATQAAAPSPLTVDQIVEKNVAARGGLDAWRKVQTMVWVGHLQTSSPTESAPPFELQMKRPDKTRFEVTVEGEKSIRAFDGKQGWRLRPPRGGKAELTPYSAEEVLYARDAPGIEGPLIDHQARGIGVELDGTDTIEQRNAYRLTVKLPSGTARHVWVDAETFLEVRYDRQSRSAGRAATVFVYYRDYKTVEGLRIPMAIDTLSPDGRGGNRMTIDRVLVNPPLEDSQFAWPAKFGRR